MSEQLPDKPPAGFEHFKRRAAAYLDNPVRLRELARRAADKAAEKRNALKDVWSDLMSLIRLLEAWLAGDYEGVSWQTMLLVTTAVLYFVMPFDVIPDFIAGLGFLDDAAVIGYVLAAVRGEVARFLAWEESRPTSDQIHGPLDQ